MRRAPVLQALHRSQALVVGQAGQRRSEERREVGRGQTELRADFQGEPVVHRGRKQCREPETIIVHEQWEAKATDDAQRILAKSGRAKFKLIVQLSIGEPGGRRET